MLLCNQNHRVPYQLTANDNDRRGFYIPGNQINKPRAFWNDNNKSVCEAGGEASCTSLISEKIWEAFRGCWAWQMNHEGAMLGGENQTSSVWERECVCFRSLSRDIAERTWMSSRRGVHTPAVAMCVCVNVCEHSFMCITECSGYFSMYMCLCCRRAPAHTTCCFPCILPLFVVTPDNLDRKKNNIICPRPINKTLAVKAFTLRDCFHFFWSSCRRGWNIVWGSRDGNKGRS